LNIVLLISKLLSFKFYVTMMLIIQKKLGCVSFILLFYCCFDLGILCSFESVFIFWGKTQANSIKLRATMKFNVYWTCPNFLAKQKHWIASQVSDLPLKYHGSVSLTKKRILTIDETLLGTIIFLHNLWTNIFSVKCPHTTIIDRLHVHCLYN
jgi:hypothetical protein